jgi:RNA polymerase sigma-70 factor, ECF subfamily
MSTVNPTHPLNEDGLVRQAAAGDLEAFNQLVLRHQNMAYNHALALVGDQAEAEDVTQESFVKSFQALQTFRGGSFRGWLLKIVTNTAYDILRRSRRHPSQPLFPQDDEGDETESPAWLADPNASVQAAVERNEESKRLQSLLDELPDVYRSVITLVDLYELDYTEAAQALRVPVGTVKSRLARARLQMQRKLRGGNEAPLGFNMIPAACGQQSSPGSDSYGIGH